MKLSCLPVSLYPELTAGTRTLADWFRFAAELGLDGADVSVVHLPGRTPAALRPLRRQAEEAGVQIAMLVTYADFTHPDAAERARQVEEIRAFCEVAAELGASFMRVTAGQNHPGVARAEGIEWAVAGLTACLDKAASTGVTLCYENHTKGYAWTYNDFSQPADRFLEIVRRTEGTGLRLLYDTANTLGAGDDPLAVLEQVKDRVSVVHVNDIRRAGYFEPCLLGTGVAPVQEIFTVLVQNGFDGWVSVEEASKTGEDGFRTAIPRAQALWAAAGGAHRQASTA
jgi:sugar phosphate isomerase/epimerase